jgi:cation transport regulator ChaB
MSNEAMNAWGNVNTEESNNGGGGQQDRPDFLKLEIGDNKIRILDLAPHSYKERYVPSANDGKGASLPYFGKEDLMEKENQDFMKKIFQEADDKKLKDKKRKDFLRDEGYKKQPWNKIREKHIIHVLDRATGEVKLLDKGNGIFKHIKKLAMNSDWGDPRFYDITISMDGDKNDFQTIEYSVTASPNKGSITDAERKLYEEKKIDLAQFKSAGDMTPEQAYKIAQGATFTDVLGNGSESSDEVNEKADTNDLPKEEETQETSEKQPEKPEVDKEEELSAEELENMEF